MAKITLILFIFVFVCTCSCGPAAAPYEYHGYCINMFLNSMALLKKLQNCTVVVGDLKVLLLERAKASDFEIISFPNLKEVTGFMVVYRVVGLKSLGDLFPNLTRIRGTSLLYNYALVVYDMPHLREVGFYNLLKIDRGGVIIWGGPLTCFVDTINWNVIAPRSRHVLSAPDNRANCNIPCSCSRNPAANYCWNNRKCQRFLDGTEGEGCSSHCIGCRNTNQSSCSLCREYTYKKECVSKCPNDTLLLSVSNHCVTRDECYHLNRWAWGDACVSECPDNYVKSNQSESITCILCDNCQKMCGNLSLQTLASIQEAEKCVYVNGSLTIHVRSIPNVANELRFYLKNIVEVYDYILIYGSITLTSLDFLQSLKLIKGNRLHNDKYSLVVYNMQNLQAIFISNVTKNLKVEQGTFTFFRNPMLCLSQIEKLKPLFSQSPTELDIPQGLNGYSGSCKEVSLGLKVIVTNETSAVATFYPTTKTDVHYTILYVRIPYGSNESMVPETCSESEWDAISIPSILTDKVKVKLPALRAASTYAVCIEKFEPSTRHLARSAIINFTTPVGKPEPPFILELVASTSDVIVIRWANHKDYRSHITRYELDIYLVDISETVTLRNHCLHVDQNWIEIDYTRHAKVMRAPRNYESGCESMCGVLSSATVGAMVEDYFDVCSAIKGCEYDEYERPNNITKEGFIQTVALNLTGPKDNFQIGGLAPYRDYRFKLRACTKEQCSRSARETVRTLQSTNADIATIIHAEANTSGYISVQWAPPELTNGPLLSYTIKVYPSIELNEVSRVLPQIWCVSGNETSLTVKSNIANNYVIKICCTTLGSSFRCSDSENIDVEREFYQTWSWSWQSGIIFGLILYITSIAIGWKFKLRNRRSDDIPLVTATCANRNESDPPAIMLTDFKPLYSIPFHDSQ